jgi:hypothetical protein
MSKGKLWTEWTSCTKVLNQHLDAIKRRIQELEQE